MAAPSGQVWLRYHLARLKSGSRCLYFSKHEIEQCSIGRRLPSAGCPESLWTKPLVAHAVTATHVQNGLQETFTRHLQDCDAVTGESFRCLILSCLQLARIVATSARHLEWSMDNEDMLRETFLEQRRHKAQDRRLRCHFANRSSLSETTGVDQSFHLSMLQLIGDSIVARTGWLFEVPRSTQGTTTRFCLAPQ